LQRACIIQICGFGRE